MPEPLIITESRLQMHFNRIAQILQSQLALTAEVGINIEWSVAPVSAGLVGEGCEYIERNRGLGIPVAPLLRLHQGLWAWLGYREEWDEERPNRNIQRFSFRSTSMTIHFGMKNDLFKPQIFRAEWSGWAKWGNLHYGFQASNAGHPHWQFDVLDSLADDDATVRAAILRELLIEEGDKALQEFSPQMDSTDVRDVITTQKLSRIHFASAAAWWNQPPHNEHTHHPSKTNDIETWVQSCLEYLKVELERLQAG